jgi:hypothetical protein
MDAGGLEGRHGEECRAYDGDSLGPGKAASGQNIYAVDGKSDNGD